MSLEVNAQPTPNPNALKFEANQTLFEASTSVKKGEETDHPLAQALIQIEGVDNIFGMNDFVTVNKEPHVEWDDIVGEIEKAFQQAFS